MEFTEIKHGELTSGEFSEPQSKRKKLKDEKYDEIILIMSTFCNENVMSYMDKLVEVYCKEILNLLKFVRFSCCYSRITAC